MQKEEQALAQRLAYAAQLRAQGLTKNDQKLLDQAEAVERQALDYYLRRVKQFESTRVSNSKSSTQAHNPVASRRRNRGRSARRATHPQPATGYAVPTLVFDVSLSLTALTELRQFIWSVPAEVCCLRCAHPNLK